MTSIHLLVFAAAIVAGFIDAIAGGSGIIMVPVLIFSGLDPKAAIATNKLINAGGTLTSMLRFAKGKFIDLTSLKWMVPSAICGAVLGSQLISKLDNRLLEPIIVVLLAFTTALTLLRPRFGQDNVQSETQALTSRQKKLLVLVGGLIGFHDGFFGPGAGIFYTFALVGISETSFLRGMATSKAINLITTLIALVSFTLAGKVNFSIGLIGTAGIIVGSYFGADFAARGGVKVVRPVFLTISLATLTKLVIIPMFY